MLYMTVGIPSLWRLRKQFYKLEGIHKVDQRAGIALGHMRSSEEVIDQVKKNALFYKQLEEKKELQRKKDKINLEEVRSRLAKDN